MVSSYQKLSSVVKMTPWLMAIFCLATAGCSNVTDQQTSETHHDQQVAILKQIRKVNEDGSYTYGYEAGDGSFKEQVSVVQSIPRGNRTTTTKKPNVVYPTSTEASTKVSVVQSIPRNRKTTTSTTSTTTTTEQPKTIFGHYLKGPGKSRPRFVINGQQRPLVIEEDEEDVTEDEDSQINRPSTEDKTSTYRRIIFAKRPIDQTLRPITDDFLEKEDDGKTGNNLRRQLQEDNTKPNPIVESSSDDHSDVYGGSLSTTRPLFTTTTPPRLLQRVSASRVDRPKIYPGRENIGPARFENAKYENPRAFVAETKTSQQERPQTVPVLIRGPERMPDNRDYVRQSTEPIFIRQQAEQFLRELPGGRILVPAPQRNNEDDPAFGDLPLNRILLRTLPSQQPIYSTTTDANIHYLTENPLPEQEEEQRVQMVPSYVRARPFPRPVIYQDPEQRPRPVLRPVLTSVPQTVDDREYQTTSEFPYRSSTIALPPEPPNPIAPPLSRRDFQLLLRRLLVSQYGVQALSYPKSYLEDALYDQQPYPSYQPGYQTNAPRPDIAYDQQIPLQYGDRVPVRRPIYTRALNPVYPPQQYEDYTDGRYSKRVYRQKFYTQEVTDEGDEILPAPIREALLLRMLQLAINAERPPMITTPVMTTTTPASGYRKTGPVRNVQIITDDEEEEKETMKKKM